MRILNTNASVNRYQLCTYHTAGATARSLAGFLLQHHIHDNVFTVVRACRRHQPPLKRHGVPNADPGLHADRVAGEDATSERRRRRVKAGRHAVWLGTYRQRELQSLRARVAHRHCRVDTDGRQLILKLYICEAKIANNALCTYKCIRVTHTMLVSLLVV